jgi:hypothetical protein
MAMYTHPLLWLGLAIVAIVQLEPIWLTLVGECFLCLCWGRVVHWNWCEMMLIGAVNSHCSVSIDYEHPRFLPMRQIQSCIEPRRQRLVLWRYGEDYRRWDAEPLLHQGKLMCSRRGFKIDWGLNDGCCGRV